MNSKAERFYNFINSEKTRSFIAFILYILFIVMHMNIYLPLVYFIILISVILFVFSICMPIWFNEKLEKKSGENIIQKIKKLTKEIAMFIPFLFSSTFITSFILIGEPANETNINESFGDAVIFNTILIIFIGPIFEEFIFRLLPYELIKSKTLYIFISAFVFAGIHVVDDANAFYNIWFYIPNALYFGYRYHKTNDLLVTISIHCFNNLLATLPLIVSYF